MLSIITAAAQGVDRVRKPVWSIPEDHLKIDLIDGKPGPWLHLYSPFNQECNAQDPVTISFMEVDYSAEIYEAYSGPLPDSEAYREKAAQYTGALTNRSA